jgi:hypothetical protein
MLSFLYCMHASLDQNLPTHILQYSSSLLTSDQPRSSLEPSFLTLDAHGILRLPTKKVSPILEGPRTFLLVVSTISNCKDTR